MDVVTAIEVGWKVGPTVEDGPGPASFRDTEAIGVLQTPCGDTDDDGDVRTADGDASARSEGANCNVEISTVPVSNCNGRHGLYVKN